MRGLPPPPAEVAQVMHVWSIDGGLCSSAVWVSVPGLALPPAGYLETFLGDWILGPLGDLLDMLASDVSCDLLQISTWGSFPSRHVQRPPANSGNVGGGSAPLNAASCTTWTTSTPGPDRARFLLPLPEAFVDADRRQLTSSGIGTLRVAALNFITDVAAVLSPSGQPCSIIGLARAVGGSPLPASQVLPVYGAETDVRVARCSRRLLTSRR